MFGQVVDTKHNHHTTNISSLMPNCLAVNGQHRMACFVLETKTVKQLPVLLLQFNQNSDHKSLRLSISLSHLTSSFILLPHPISSFRPCSAPRNTSILSAHLAAKGLGWVATGLAARETSTSLFCRTGAAPERRRGAEVRADAPGEGERGV